MISQTIAGALEMYCLPIDLLAPRNEACGIFGVGFAFDGYTACLGGDGRRSRQLSARSSPRASAFTASTIARSRLSPDHHEVESRSSTPDDLKGFKIRLPVAPYLIALFQPLGASPTPINFGEVYSALQTGLVDGQENPLILIDTAKLYEVQKYCSMTNHVWAGIHYSFGNPYWDKLPPDLKELSTKHFNAAAMTERDDWQKMTGRETKNLTGKGMVFNTPDIKPFQEVLKKAGFYARDEEEVRRQGLGACWKNTSGRWPDRREAKCREPASSRKPQPSACPGAARGAPPPSSTGRSAASPSSSAPCWCWPRPCILFAGVVSRYVFNSPLMWTDELATFLFLWLAMFGAVVAVRRGGHMRLTTFVEWVAPKCPRLARHGGRAGGHRLRPRAHLCRPWHISRCRHRPSSSPCRFPTGTAWWRCWSAPG